MSKQAEPIVIPDDAERVLENIVYHVNHRVIGPTLQAAPSTLTATYAEGERATPWLLQTSFCESILYMTKNAEFRSYLAYIGRNFMNGQLYGGKITQEICYEGQTFLATFQMKNNQQEGFSITINARPQE